MNKLNQCKAFGQKKGSSKQTNKIFDIFLSYIQIPFLFYLSPFNLIGFLVGNTRVDTFNEWKFSNNFTLKNFRKSINQLVSQYLCNYSIRKTLTKSKSLNTSFKKFCGGFQRKQNTKLYDHENSSINQYITVEFVSE